MNRNMLFGLTAESPVPGCPERASFPPARGGVRGRRFRVALLALLLLFVLGCGTSSVVTRENVIARAGSHELTMEEFEALSGVPLDSITGPERWTIINNWIENAVVEQEGERRGLRGDPAIIAQMDRLRSELYLARILKEDRDDEIDDEEIETYFAEHRPEFVQTEDGYLLELYFAPDCTTLSAFQQRYSDGELELPEDGSIVLEQRWLAQSSELNEHLRGTLSGMSPGSWTESRDVGEGCRVIHLVSTWLAGARLDLDAARGEIELQLRIDKTHRQREDLMSELRGRYPVTIFLEEIP